MWGKYMDHGLENVHKAGQIGSSYVTTRLCYTIQAIMEAHINPESNLLNVCRNHQIKNVGRPEALDGLDGLASIYEP
jgi:hypothetical protein